LYSASNFLFAEPSSIWSEDSIEAGGVDAEGSGDLWNGFSFLDEPAGEVSLLLVLLFGPTETNSPSFCVYATGPSALPNQIAFKFCYARENSHDHLAGMRGGVSPGLGNRLETGARVADRFHDLQEITGGARQTVELPDGYNVALAQLIEHPVEFRPVTVSSRDFLTKDSGASGLFERF
jgi:hypothetical protein